MLVENTAQVVLMDLEVAELLPSAEHYPHQDLIYTPPHAVSCEPLIVGTLPGIVTGEELPSF